MIPERKTTAGEAGDVLARCTQGVLSLVTPDGLPYGVMLNYVFDRERNALYFHCATAGKKLDCIAHSPAASFFAALPSRIVEERFTTYYDSALVTGVCRLVEQREEKLAALRLIGGVLAPGGADRLEEVIAGFWPSVAILRLDIGKIEGKRNRDL